MTQSDEASKVISQFELSSNASMQTQRYLRQIQGFMLQTYNLEELRSLAFELGIELDDISGDNRLSKSIEFLVQLERRNRIPELITLLQEQRPEVEWPIYYPVRDESFPPFKGLAFFDVDDKELFSGREKLTAQMIQHLNGKPLLVLVGASGSGKSSAVRAGLIPAVQNGHLKASSFELGEKLPSREIFIFTPTEKPLEALALVLTSEMTSAKATETIIEELFERPERLALHLKKFLKRRNKERLFIVVDQFEELFTLCKSEGERTAFINGLFHAVLSESGHILQLVITLRADFYDHCAPYPQLRHALSEYQVYIGSMTHEELKRAITRPATLKGYVFESGLIEQILRDIGSGEHQEPEPGALPLLSHALLETWRRRNRNELTLQGYQAAGGVQGAIAETAEAIYQNSPTEQQEIIRQIFLRLTELGDGTQDTRRRVKRHELLSLSVESELINDILSFLANSRLITVDETVVEVAHEALIREWPTLRQWLNENREWLQIHRQLTSATSAWKAGEGDLYGKTRLEYVSELVAKHKTELNLTEAEFLRESQLSIQREEKEKEELRNRELESQKRRYTVTRRALILISVLLIFAIIATGVAVEATQRAQAETDKAVTQASIAQSQSLAVAAQNVVTSDPLLSLLISIEANNLANTTAAESAILQAASFLPRRRFVLTNAGEVRGAMWVKNESQILTWSLDNVVRLWDANTGQKLQQFVLDGFPSFPILSKSGDKILVGDSSGTVHIWDLDNGNEILQIEGGESIGEPRWNHDESLILTTNESGLVQIWDSTTGNEISSFSHEASVSLATWNQDESLLLTTSADNAVHVWDIENRIEVARFVHDNLRRATWNQDESLLLTWGEDGTARIWSMDIGNELQRFSHTQGVNGASWSQDGMEILTWSSDGDIVIWNTASGEEVQRLRHGDNILGAQWSHDENKILTWGYDATARLWDANTGNQLMVFAHEVGVHNAVYGISWNEDDHRLMTRGGDNIMRMWDTETGLMLQAFNHEDWVYGMIWNNDRTQVISWSKDKTVVLWELNIDRTEWPLSSIGSIGGFELSDDSSKALVWSADGIVYILDFVRQRIVQTHSHNDFVWSAVWSHDQKQVMSWSKDHTIRISDATTGQLIQKLEHDSWVRGAIWNKTGSLILSWSDDGSVRLWDAMSGNEVTRFVHIGSVLGAIWNQDESKILSWTYDGLVHIWDARSGRTIATFAHDDIVYGANWTLDESMVVSWSQDGTTRLWNPITGELVHKLVHENAMLGVELDPDGNRLITYARDDKGYVWDIQSGQKLWTIDHNQVRIYGVAISSNGEQILSWGRDNLARIWDVSSGTILQEFLLRGEVYRAGWNKEETLIFTQDFGSTSKNVKVWIAGTGVLLATIYDEEDTIISIEWNHRGDRLLIATNKALITSPVFATAESACDFVTRNLTWAEWHRFFPGQAYRQTCPNLPIHPLVPTESNLLQDQNS